MTQKYILLVSRLNLSDDKIEEIVNGEFIKDRTINKLPDTHLSYINTGMKWNEIDSIVKSLKELTKTYHIIFYGINKTSLFYKRLVNTLRD